MLWGTLWLTAVLIAITSAGHRHGAITIEHDFVPPQDTPQELHTVDDSSLATSENTPSISTGSSDSTGPSTSTKEAEVEVGGTTKEETNEDDTVCIECDTDEQRTSEDNGNDGGRPPRPNTIEEDDDNTDNDEPPSAPPPAVVPESESRVDVESGGDNDGGAGGGNTDENLDDGLSNENLIVETKSGPVQGYLWRESKENIISYIDIPYGSFKEPFQAATPAEKWESIHDIKEHNKRCPQLVDSAYVGDMDCLTLSIFKPLDAEDASILFHIHAENFNTGSGDPSIYGPEHLVTNGIILVLPNYRLGPLGFLCLQNETAPGNIGLKDLSLALSWINDNIKSFGGDPDNIAVSGDGRSGALAGLLALSPMSQNYVNKVIAESGSFLSHWALDRNPSSTAAELWQKIQAAEDGQSNRDISLGEIAVTAIVRAAEGIEFRPCVEIGDNAFMTAAPYIMITSKHFENTKFLLGSAMFAGVHEALLQTEESIKKLNEDYSLLLPSDLTFTSETIKSEVGGRVKAQYFGNGAINLDDVKQLSLCFTDIGYLGPGIRSARLLVAAEATVYFYEFAYVGEMNRVLESIDRPVEGAVRGDIVGYLFTQDGVVPDAEQTSESKMIESLTKMWANFLKTGTPSTDVIKWNKLEEKEHLEEEWLLINSEPSLKKGLHVDRLPLWTDIYEKHYIDRPGNRGYELSPSVYTVLIFQFIFWLGICCNASHVV